MNSHLIQRFLCGVLVTVACGVVAATAQTPPAPGPQQTVVVGPNVNMAGGPASFTPPATLVGDPFLQRQNEPSLAVSSRNPCHLLAGANDYRAVDIEEAAGEVGDAWLGVFKSFDCGATWTSTLLPGHKLDDSVQGQNAIKGLAAAADPTVRAGTSGLFYYSGIAFNRGESGVGRVFVARFIDNNNKDGGDPIQYLGLTPIDQGTSGQFLDKPWIVADIPRGSATCVINGREIPAGPAYLVYTSFLGSGSNVHSKILFSRSTDCGATWSNPSKLSESVARNQGTTIAIDPDTGAIHIAWREFAIAGDSNSRDAIVVTRSTNGGASFSKATRITTNLQPFDQASSPLTFRTNAYPTIAVVPAQADGRGASQAGRVYVAWAARGFGTARSTDARIVYSTSVGGATWSTPRAVDQYPDAGHQIMPALAFAGGKLALAYYDLRDDASEGFDDLVFEHGQKAYTDCSASFGPLGFAAVYACIVTHPEGLSRRHTLDMRASMADTTCLGAGTCTFTSYSVVGGGSRKVSRYIEGRGNGDGLRVQLQYNRPNLPLFSKGRFPFIGDYIDIAGQNFVARPEGGWAWNTGHTANRPAPVFHVSWADNRNVGTPRNSNWEIYTPPVLGPNGVQCLPGQVGVRNQDIYAAQLRPGLIVAAPLNSKRITGLQRSFVVVARNATTVERDYVMRAAAPAGVIASFDQFSGFGAPDADNPSEAPLTELHVRIPALSTASRTLFVDLVSPPEDPAAAPDVLVPVHVEELAAGTGLPTGTFDMVYLNPDFENPDFENPDFENAELHNPDFENLDFENPDFENPDFENFTLAASSSIRNPDFENPDFENPDFENPDFENPDFENPDFENPDFENPDFENPDFENPDFENPDFENPDFENGSFEVADTTWPVRNNGNTSSAYKANVFVNDPPEGVKYQLTVRKIFNSPAAVCTVPGDTSAAMSAQSVSLVNIVGPDVSANLFERNFNDPSRENATFMLGPGERALITLRAYCSADVPACTRPLMGAMEGTTALGVVAQGANCVRCTGPNCSNTDLVGGFTECLIDGGPPKDVYDPIPPEIAVLDPTLTAPEVVVAAPDTDNNGSESVSVSLLATDNVGIVDVKCTSPTMITVASLGGGQYSLSGNFPLGDTLLSCTAYDARISPAPNSSSVEFTVRVVDVTPPSFANPAFTFLSAPTGTSGWYTTPSVAAVAQVSDISSVTLACTDSIGGTTVDGVAITIQGDGVHQLTCTATDTSNLTSKAATTIKIDSSAPTITLPGTMVVEATSALGAVVPFSVVAADSVDSSPTLTCSPAAGALFPLGSTIVTCTASDDAGNSTVGAFMVRVIDSAPPASFTATVTPALLWPPTGQITNVVVSGTVYDVGSGVARIDWSVHDEYGQHQPSGSASIAGNGPFSFTIGLLNDRRGNDKDGRRYAISLTAYDQAGNARPLAKPLVVTIHDKSGR